jgi:hypothetical protein
VLSSWPQSWGIGLAQRVAQLMGSGQLRPVGSERGVGGVLVQGWERERLESEGSYANRFLRRPEEAKSRLQV